MVSRMKQVRQRLLMITVHIAFFFAFFLQQDKPDNTADIYRGNDLMSLLSLGELLLLLYGADVGQRICFD